MMQKLMAHILRDLVPPLNGKVRINGDIHLGMKPMP